MDRRQLVKLPTFGRFCRERIRVHIRYLSKSGGGAACAAPPPVDMSCVVMRYSFWEIDVPVKRQDLRYTLTINPGFRALGGAASVAAYPKIQWPTPT